MIGAVVGDITGSVYENMTTKRTDVSLFHYLSRPTDDSVMTLAVAAAVVHAHDAPPEYVSWMRKLGRAYPDAGYGGHFKRWLSDGHAGPYQSWGNGSAMRVSAIGWAWDLRERVLAEAEASAALTHDHPEGIKGAQAVALAVYRARSGARKEQIRDEIAAEFAYDLSRSLDEIRPRYHFEVSCQKSVPEAIIAFLESDDYESAVRNAISLGGDADTQAAIAGSIAEAYYGAVPPALAAFALPRLSDELLHIATEFSRQFATPTLPLLEEELRARASGSLADTRHAYTVLMHAESWAHLTEYTARCNAGADPDAAATSTAESPGPRVRAELGRLPVIDPSPEWVLHALLNSKKPRIFAESEVAGDGSDWTHEELRLLGDVSIAVPCVAYDNGLHVRPAVHQTPVLVTLLFVPGALLQNGRGGEPVDADVIADGRIDLDRYTGLYERRLLPALKYASADALRLGTRALVTLPGLGCGQFAGRFRGTLGVRFGEAQRRILQDHHASLDGIRAVWYDPYSEGAPSRETIGSVEFLTRPLTNSSHGTPQLCHPSDYEEPGDSFSDCRLYSVGAWDHVSWPGNDFVGGSRATDDGVKAAATDALYRLTGVRGRYNAQTNTYDPPDGYRTWKELIEKNRLELRTTAGLVIVSGEGGEEDDAD